MKISIHSTIQLSVYFYSLKKKIKPNYPNHESSICCNPKYGPTFGDDIHKANNSNTTFDCYISFKHPEYEQETNEDETFFAGANYLFQIAEIEVFQKE